MRETNSRIASVVGLGYVGLNICRSLVESGYTVNGIDNNEHQIRKLAVGTSPISDFDDATIREMANHGFTATSSYATAADSQVILIAVPTPLREDNLPDLAPLISAISSLEQVIHQRPLIIVESTVAPGTTGGLVRNLLEANGKKVGKDFLLAFSPERINPGSRPARPEQSPKIVAGFDDEALSSAVSTYENAGYAVVTAATLEAAEASKLLENTYRAVNMSLITELAFGFVKLGIDPTEVIRLAATKPYGFEPFYPGIGVGGHCIPIDPWYLLSEIEQRQSEAPLLRSALELNDKTTAQVAEQIDIVLRNRHHEPKKPSVLILGMTYKADVSDFRESPGPVLVSEMSRKGYQVGFHDPFLSRESITKRRWLGKFERELDSALTEYDVIIIAQNHSAYDSSETLRLAKNVYWAAGAASPAKKSVWSASAAMLNLNANRGIPDA